MLMNLYIELFLDKKMNWKSWTFFCNERGDSFFINK